MRHDIHNIAELKLFLEECDTGDRMVIWTSNDGPARFRVGEEDMRLESCDAEGNAPDNGEELNG